MKTIALCLNIAELQTHFRDPAVCKKYPGAGFLPHLAEYADKQGWRIMGGQEIAPTGDLSDVFILQEELNQNGFALIPHGAKPQVLFCMESKMYAPIFYDCLPALKKIFKHQILFNSGTHQMYFPSYNFEDLKRKFTPWEDRKSVCMISSNKQWWSFRHPWDSPSYCYAIRNELHSARLRAIEENEDLDLYGHGWDNLDNLPPQWAFLKPKIRNIWKGPVADKWASLGQYKTAICLENVQEEGYVTEKIIDCVITKTYPIGCRSNPHGDWIQEQVRDEKKYSNEHFAQLVMELMEN